MTYERLGSRTTFFSSPSKWYGFKFRTFLLFYIYEIHGMIHASHLAYFYSRAKHSDMHLSDSATLLAYDWLAI
jgi:hypothetical protein